MNKLFIAFCMVFIIGNYAIGQNKIKDLSTKEQFRLAQNYFDKKKYEKAFEIYDIMVANDFENSHYNYKAGVCLVKAGKSDFSTVEYFEKAIEHIDPEAKMDSHKEENAPPDAFLYLGMVYHQNYNFEKALEVLKKYKKNISSGNKEQKRLTYALINWCENGIAHLAAPVDAIQIKIPEKVNLQRDDYLPLFDIDQSLMVFTSRRKETTGMKIEKDGRFKEDIYVCNLEEDFLGAPKNDYQFNTIGNESAVGLSANGKTLIIRKEDNGGDLYISEFNGNQWQEPQKMNNVNSPADENYASLSKDGKWLYFSSNRKGGKGGYDIYVAELGAGGEWQSPKNLGDKINTKADEMYPFIHYDDKTLYYSTNGDISIGGLDIVVSEKQNNVWTEAKNIGYPVNTIRDDFGYIATTDKKTGFFTSAKGFETDKNIYQVTFPKKKEADVVFVKGTIAGKFNNPKVTFFEGNQLSGTTITGSDYLFFPENNKNYRMVFEADDCLFQIADLHLNGNKGYRKIICYTQLRSFANSYFYKRFDFTAESRDEIIAKTNLDLNLIARLTPQEDVIVEFHTDTLTEDAKNIYLPLASAIENANIKIDTLIIHRTPWNGTPKNYLVVTNALTKNIAEKEYEVKFKWDKKSLRWDAPKTLQEIATEYRGNTNLRIEITVYEGDMYTMNNAETVINELRLLGVDRDRFVFNYLYPKPEKYAQSVKVRFIPVETIPDINITDNQTINIPKISFKSDRTTTSEYTHEINSLNKYLQINKDISLQVQVFTNMADESESTNAIANQRGDFVKQTLIEKGIPARNIQIKSFAKTQDFSYEANGAIRFKLIKPDGTENDVIIPQCYDNNYTVFLKTTEMPLDIEDFARIGIKYLNISKIGNKDVYCTGYFTDKAKARKVRLDTQTEGQKTAKETSFSMLKRYVTENKPDENLQDKKYTIELTSSKNPIDKIYFANFEQLGIYYHEIRKIYKFVAGEFSQKKNAVKALHEAITKGFPFAKITTTDVYKDYLYK